MWGLINKLFKSKKDKDVEELIPIVRQINKHFESYKHLSDDELRAKSAELKANIRVYVSEITKSIATLQEEAATLQRAGRIAEQEQLFEQIDTLKKDRNQAYEEVLNEILPEAFALVKETCRRFAQNGQLVVTATDFDREIANRKANVKIEGEHAIWSNRWLVTGNEIVWDMIHYDVQLMGGIVLHQGKISEMATGEGKTLVSTLPSFLNALTGEGVHIVTVNDYLARRDCEWNAPVFEFHQLTVDCIDIHQPNSDARRKAYQADIIYGTNNEFGFDYLRDNMVTHAEHLVQRAHHFAIVDEVDSVLIDEARTPLIISGPVEEGDRHEFNELKPRIERLIVQQRNLVQNCLTAARSYLAEKNEKEAGVQLLRAHRGLPKYKPLIKYLSEPGIRQLLHKTEEFYLQDKARNMHIIDDELYFHIDEKNNQIELTDKGRSYITANGEDPDLFVIPDIAASFAEIDGQAALSPEERFIRKDEITRVFAEKSERLHSIQQLLRAYSLFEKDVDYIVASDEQGVQKVMIVDENTGRVLAGRRYSDGLHQALEAKENVKIEDATQTFATITLQNYFRMYHKLAGMTGTAETEANEFYQIYKLDVVVIPTNKPVVRVDENDLVYKTRREKYNAIIEEVVRLSEAGRPVLVGTTSVESSELLSKMLTLRKIQHNVLNAKQHQREAEIVANAGKAGAVTIATNMAGRGTDIKLGEGVRESGGLAIIGSERHESRRIDRQLRGRAGRQGDPGSSQFFVSLEDDLMRLFGSERLAKIMDFLKIKEGEVIQHSMVTKTIENAQRKVEENNFGVRKRLLEYDDVMNMQREVIYDRRRNALFGERIKLDLDHALFDFCDKLVEKYFPTYDIESLELECIRRLGIAPEFTAKDLDRLGAKGVVEKIYTQAKTNYHKKEVRIAQHLFEAVSAAKASHPEVMVVEASMTDGVREVPLYLPVFKVIETEGRIMINEYEKNVVLNVIDDKWKTHLRDMDDLKQSVQNAVYEQKDPLIIYKFSAFELFQKMIEDVNAEIISMLHRGEVAAQHEIDTPIIEPKRDDFSKLAAYHNDTPPQAKNQSKPVTVQRQMPTLHDAAEPAATTEAAGVPNRTERRAKQKESFADKIKRQQLEKAKAKNTKK